MKQICAKCWLTMYPQQAKKWGNDVVCEECYWKLVRRESQYGSKEEGQNEPGRKD